MKKRKSCKIQAIALALAALLSLSACSGATASSKAPSDATSSNASSAEEKTYYNKTGYPICNDPITISMACVGTTSLEKSKTREIVEKDLGIKLNFQPVLAENWNDQLTLMLSTDKLPDLLRTPSNQRISLSKIYEYGTDGFFLNVKDYAELMPNFFGLMDGDKTGSMKRTFTSADGKIYGMGSYTDCVYDTNQVRVWLDSDYLVNSKIDKAPTTIDEFYDMLVAFKNNDANGDGNPDNEVPLGYVDTWQGDHVTKMLMSGFGITTVKPYFSLTVQDGKVSLAQTTENYKAYLKYMNRLYMEDLMSHDAFTQTREQHNANISAQLYGVFGSAAYHINNGNCKDNTHYAYIGGLASAYTGNVVNTVNSEPTETPLLFISAKTEYPEAICRLMDYYYDANNTAADFESVVEGFNYELKEYGSTGYKVLMLKDDWKGLSAEDKKTKLAGMNLDMIGTGFFSCFIAVANRDKALMKAVDDKTLHSADFINEFGWCATEEIWLRDVKHEDKYVYPVLGYSEEQNTQKSSIETDLTNIIKAKFAAFVTGKENIDSGWDAFQSELQSAGLSKLLEIEQAAFDASNK